MKLPTLTDVHAANGEEMQIDFTSGQEDPSEFVEVFSGSLADLVRRPPVTVMIVKLVWADDLSGGAEDHFGGDC